MASSQISQTLFVSGFRFQFSINNSSSDNGKFLSRLHLKGPPILFARKFHRDRKHFCFTNNEMMTETDDAFFCAHLLPLLNGDRFISLVFVKKAKSFMEKVFKNWNSLSTTNLVVTLSWSSFRGFLNLSNHLMWKLMIKTFVMSYFSFVSTWAHQKVSAQIIYRTSKCL